MRYHPIMAKVMYYLVGFSKVTEKEIAEATNLSEYEVKWALEHITEACIDVGQDTLLHTELTRHKNELAIIEKRRIMLPDGVTKYLRSLGPYNELIDVKIEKDNGLVAVETYKDGRVHRVKLEKGKIIDYIMGDEPCPWEISDPENLLRLRAIEANKEILRQ